MVHVGNLVAECANPDGMERVGHPKLVRETNPLVRTGWRESRLLVRKHATTSVAGEGFEPS
jgi:hypothetical protein